MFNLHDVPHIHYPKWRTQPSPRPVHQARHRLRHGRRERRPRRAGSAGTDRPGGIGSLLPSPPVSWSRHCGHRTLWRRSPRSVGRPPARPPRVPRNASRRGPGTGLGRRASTTTAPLRPRAAVALQAALPLSALRPAGGGRSRTLPAAPRTWAPTDGAAAVDDGRSALGAGRAARHRPRTHSIARAHRWYSATRAGGRDASSMLRAAGGARPSRPRARGAEGGRHFVAMHPAP